jgi:hypothetical protein
MDKAETNGYLKAIEAQLLAVEAAITEVDRHGNLTDSAYEALREVKIKLTNLTQSFTEVRGWNR